ncbi:angiotensin-converting enzyme-like protein Ace3 [Plodia interpunctella]|uniref:angiotensin-converting enzyme-like protein Ace3 n=1 Tax=Plodia interpunctella TaxID=58824 RepID=UPI002367D674|nr:angiotensin-converting enzyme-like protein Ace3 [Plodia interpunctella]XP_053605336.1 angiotensin-converting enzyme-like protein Ace3 [Plodia interpunctella]XP_053605337.1 angiotensin-converting enzyme-like protein Ace3 [Plodia interpunctella]XP_053605338.1 angiotensin-converting enzyme-like protein Ace3 [Plodia interpunctella]
MKPTVSLIFITLHTFLTGTTSSVDDRRLVVASVDLVELEYQDHCENRAYATWKELIGDPRGLSAKLEKDKAFGILSRQQKKDVKMALGGYTMEPSDEVLRRKVQLLLQPGDTLLDTKQWIRLVTFADTALHKIRYANDYDCGTGTNCTLRELHSSIARQQDEATLLRMKLSWERNLPSLNEYLEEILPLLRNASKENNYNGVESYWDSLVEYEGAILKARELWDNVKPLYQKLHKYIALRLKGTEAVGNTLPVHLLRSLNGDDWSNIIESLLPKHPAIYQKIHANIQLKDLGGAKAFREAVKLVDGLGFGELDTDIWTNSIFNGTCPTTIVDWCKPNKMLVVTCKDVSIGNYIDAHEAAMRIKYREIAALHSNNTYILREAPRYSAIYEAIPGFVSLLSLNPHALDRSGLFPLHVFNYNPNHHRLVLQLIMALRDLPKLNYYLAADEWRLKVLMGTIPVSKAVSSWSEFRKNFSLLETSDVDLLGDSHILFNRPYIGKFMGLILKYQIYQSFAEELSSDESDLLQHVNESSNRLSDVMMQGYTNDWTEMVSEVLAKRENGLEYTGLTDYYQLLDEYLDKQLDPSDKEEDDYNEIVKETTENNAIPPPPSTIKPTIHELDVIEPPDESENIVDVEDSHSKYSAETSTVGVLEIKKQPPVDDTKNTQEASYNTYWWIGIVVAIIIIVILIAIIARKRHNHRKQLEKQRRENTRA